MLAFLSLCLPIFAVVGLGLGAARQGLVAPAVVDAIGLFSFNVALPALLLRLMAAAAPSAADFRRPWRRDSANSIATANTARQAARYPPK